MSKNKKSTKIIKKLRDARANADRLYHQYVKLLTDYMDLKIANEKLKYRLDLAGLNTPTLEESTGPIHVIEVDMEPYGMYAVLTEEPTELDIDLLKKRFTKRLVESMLANNLVQFIHKSPDGFGDPMNEHFTYAAKMFVVPWEQMRVFGSHVRLYEYLGSGVKDGRGGE